MNRKKLTLRCVCEGAVFLAMAQLLGYLKLFELPQGGSITPAMLPLVVFGVRWGLVPGLFAGVLYGLLQLLLDGAYAWGWISILFDYLIAFGLLGLAGLFRGRRLGLVWGAVAGCFGRFLSHLVSGVLYVRGTSAFSIYGVNTASPWLYSAIYNGAYMLPTMLLTVLLGWLLTKSLGRYLRGEDR